MVNVEPNRRKWPFPIPDSFHMNGHGDPISAQTVAEGSKAAKPADPSADGWIFNGWYTDTTLSAAFDFDTAIKADTAVYAKWTEKGIPKTGDNSQMFLWTVLMLISGTLLGTAVYGGKRKELNDQQP